MAPGKRRPELSWLNLAFCALVLWSHSSSYALTHLDHNSWQYALMYSLQRMCFVSVYGFFFLSGLKLTLSRKKPPSPLAFWAKRGKSLVLPYCLAVAVYYVWFCAVLHYFPFSLPDYLGYLIRGDLSSPFYFAVALIQFTLFAPLLRRLAEGCSALLLVPASMVITLLSTVYFNDVLRIFLPEASFPYSDRVFTTYLVYYLAGCCAGRRYDEFLDMLKRNRTFICVMTAFLAATDIILRWFSYTGRRSVPFTFLTAMLFYLSAILYSFLAALRLPQKMPKPLAAINQASFLIYLYHSLALSWIDYLLQRLGITRVSAVFPLRASFTFIVTPAVCILWQRLWAAIKSFKQQPN